MASKRRLRKSETRCGAYGANLNGSIWFSFQALACCSFLVSPALSQFGLTRTRDLCRDSTEAGSNLLKLSVTDGFFWRSKVSLVTVIGPLSDPRPLPCRPLPKKDFASTSSLA
jgi:hypothetical protein